MKYLVCILLVLGSSSASHAQGSFLPFRENGKWGLKDSSGSVFSKPIFDTMVVVENLALVNMGGHSGNFGRYRFEGGKWGLITLEGKTLFEPKFEEIEYFSGGVAEAKLNGKWGLIDTTGKIIIEPQFDFLLRLDSIALVNIGGHKGEDGRIVGGKSGLINLQGKIIFKPTFDEILYEPTSANVMTSAGCIVTKRGFYDMQNECWFVKTNGKWGLIDRNGKFLIKQKFDHCHFSGQGLFQVNVGGKIEYGRPVGGKWGLVNSRGILIVEPKFDKIDDFFLQGSASFRLNDHWGLIDETGKIIIEPKFDFLFFHYDHGWVNIGGKWGLVNSMGKIIIEPKFDIFQDFYRYLAAVNIGGHYESGKPVGGKWGLIDTTGKIIIEPKFEGPISYSTEGAAEFKLSRKSGLIDTGFCFIKTNGKWGLIDRRGEFLIEPKFDFIPDFDRNSQRSVFNGHVVAQINMGGRQGNYGIVGGKWGLIDTTGSIIIETQFDFFRFLRVSDTVALVNNGGHEDVQGIVGGKWGLINYSGKIIIEPKFDFFRDFSGNVAQVNIGGHQGENSPYDPVGGKWGLVDRSGKFIIEPKYDFCTNFNDANGAWHFPMKAPDDAEVYIGECDESGWPTDNGKWSLIDNTGKVIRFEK